MKQYLKTFRLTLKTAGPVFVGSGKEISKKEYIFLGRDKIAVLDIPRVYAALKKKGKERAYEKYLLDFSKDDMSTWLRRENISMEVIKPYIRYVLSNRDLEVQHRRKLQIMECIKNPYGEPYIPGSSLKGMLRTILLGESIIRNKKQYEAEKENIVREVFSKKDSKRTTFLKSNISEVENICYHTRQLPDTRRSDAVNDYFQGIIISDSYPLKREDLVLCQQIELHRDGRENCLPLLRECIKPGTEIMFDVTIDTSICPVNEQRLMEAIKAFMTVYFQCFGKMFPGLDKLYVNQVFLGGGCGFLSKTCVYPMFGYKDGVKVTKEIFFKTKVPRSHKHEMDDRYGVSPHILKCTRYQGKLLRMGLCSLKIKEK